MKLLVFILKNVELQDEILLRLAHAGIKGGTLIEGKGMAKTLANMDEMKDDVPIFGTLRHIISDNIDYKSSIMMFVLENQQLDITKKIIKKVTGDLNKPNTGIMFTINIEEVEGYKN